MAAFPVEPLARATCGNNFTTNSSSISLPSFFPKKGSTKWRWRRIFFVTTCFLSLLFHSKFRRSVIPSTLPKLVRAWLERYVSFMLCCKMLLRRNPIHFQSFQSCIQSREVPTCCLYYSRHLQERPHNHYQYCCN